MPVFLAATAGLTIIASMFFASSQIFSTQFLAFRERIEESFKIQVPVAAVLNSNPSVLFNEAETIAQDRLDKILQRVAVQTLIAPVENFPLKPKMVIVAVGLVVTTLRVLQLNLHKKVQQKILTRVGLKAIVQVIVMQPNK